MTAFEDLHRGNKVRLYELDGETVLPPVWLMLEDARPCEPGRCCEAWAQVDGALRPQKLHACCTAEVVLLPKAPAPAEFPAPQGDAVAVTGAGPTQVGAL
ncbi:hypothetical protein [Sphaerisporangium sp. TRM90804]|uniref:hypothetical protein n=1 Tax=Sphaerisporangium sp. TRM90804 TaxID=3031113 RepID=UPI00244B296A|nr:hypothetical protein [Sphaerisporangium sp. TRM90804]MDH2424848.1 hypothetical protein [Sphaerisporangium sp. TRM90804]